MGKLHMNLLVDFTGVLVSS